MHGTLSSNITSFFNSPTTSPNLIPVSANNKKDVSNANSASAALNKWLKPMLPEKCVVHSFRHSFRDRLRAVECPSDIIDAIGGWKTFGVGQGYGSGYGLDVKYKWMRMVEFKFSVRKLCWLVYPHDLFTQKATNQ